MLQGEGGSERARRLRQEMSVPEIILWQALRARPENLKFRRQHPAGHFTVDFYCHVARLIIEVDGEAHNRGDHPGLDANRNRWFAIRQIEVMRIPAIDIMRDCDAVVRGIVALATSRSADQE